MPALPFSYSFLDDSFDALYRTELRLNTLVTVFSLLAIVIACMGLFGLAAFTGAQRAKEISVRKVLGADVLNVVALLSKDFLKPVSIGILLAFPITYYAVEEWLSGFAYKTNVGWMTFAQAGAIAIAIALLTVGAQSIRSASTNPVKNLRSE